METAKALTVTYLARIRGLGGRVLRGPFKNLSITLPWGWVVLRKGLMEGNSPVSGAAPVLAHELCHLERMRARGAFVWTLLYILSPRFRLEEEIEGEAHECAARARCYGAVRASHRLGGHQWPYCLGGDHDAISGRILGRAAELLEEEL